MVIIPPKAIPRELKVWAAAFTHTWKTHENKKIESDICNVLLMEYCGSVVTCQILD